MVYLVEKVKDEAGNGYPDYNAMDGKVRDGLVVTATSVPQAIRMYQGRVHGADGPFDGERYDVREIGPEHYVDISRRRVAFATTQRTSAWDDE